MILFNFFAIFFFNFLARVESERNSGLKFFSLFLGLSHTGFDRNNVGMNFFNFLNFFAIFFCEFSCLGPVGMEFGTIFFCSSLAYIISVQIEIMQEWCFLIFWIFFLFFFGIFLPGSCRNEIWDKNFLLSFSAYLIPIWIEIMPEWFYLYSEFLLFFLEFSSLGWVGTEFGTKYFFFFTF